MADAINPHQFASTEYANADMYGALLQRPAPGIPLEKSLPVLELNRTNASEIEAQKRLYQQEWQRTEAARTARKEAEAARDQEIIRREQAQRQAVKNRISGIEAPETLPPKGESPLSQIQRSTPERQPLPPTGAPPPTPNGTAARADSLVEPTATPRSAAIREAIGNTVGGIGQSLPKSLPQAAGRLVIPGIGAGLTFAGALIAGESIQQAAISTVSTVGGSIAGGIIGTAVGGPIGGYVGSMVGGFIGGYLGNAIFPPQLPTPATPKEEHTPRYIPFIGGQNPGVLYYVKIAYPGVNSSVSYSLSAPILGSITAFATVAGSDGVWTSIIYYDNGTQSDASRNSSTAFPSPYISEIYRADGAIDYPPAGAGTVSPPPNNAPYYLQPSPLNEAATVPSGTPGAGKNKGKTREIAPSMPSNNTPNGAPFFPGHGGLAPSYLPNPEHQPSNLGGMSPAIKNAPQPLPFAEPEDKPVPRISPMISEGTVSTTATNPGTFAFPAYVPELAKPVPISDALSPTPKSKSAPIAKTPTELSNDGIKTALDQQKKDFDDQIGRLTAIATAIAALTPAIQGIPDAIAKSPTVKASTQGAVCEIAQPGGCLGNALDDSANKINQNNNQNTANLLDKINAGANAAQLALLEIINTKLGAQLSGGISGFLQTFFDGFNKLTEWLHLDRALNLLTFIMTVQNVYFLCDSMKVVTLQMISDTLAVFGIKDKDNNPLNLNEILGHEVESLLKSILGEQELEGIKKEWKAFNRIYQAATNMLFAIQNMVFSVLQALEIIGSWNASIGNALKKYLVVGKDAFNWMNPNPNFHNNFFKFLGNALNVVTSLDFVAQSILQGRQAIDDFGKQTDELTKNIGEAADGFKPPENKARADAATASANVSKSPIPSPEDINSLQ